MTQLDSTERIILIIFGGLMAVIVTMLVVSAILTASLKREAIRAGASPAEVQCLSL